MRIDAVPFQSCEHDGLWVGELESEQLFFSDPAADFQSRQRLRSIAENGSGCRLDGHLCELLKIWDSSAHVGGFLNKNEYFRNCHFQAHGLNQPIIFCFRRLPLVVH